MYRKWKSSNWWYWTLYFWRIIKITLFLFKGHKSAKNNSTMKHIKICTRTWGSLLGISFIISYPTKPKIPKMWMEWMKFPVRNKCLFVCQDRHYGQTDDGEVIFVCHHYFVVGDTVTHGLHIFHNINLLLKQKYFKYWYR